MILIIRFLLWKQPGRGSLFSFAERQHNTQRAPKRKQIDCDMGGSELASDVWKIIPDRLFEGTDWLFTFISASLSHSLVVWCYIRSRYIILFSTFVYARRIDVIDHCEDSTSLGSAEIIRRTWTDYLSASTCDDDGLPIAVRAGILERVFKCSPPPFLRLRNLFTISYFGGGTNRDKALLIPVSFGGKKRRKERRKGRARLEHNVFPIFKGKHMFRSLHFYLFWFCLRLRWGLPGGGESGGGDFGLGNEGLKLPSSQLRQ